MQPSGILWMLGVQPLLVELQAVSLRQDALGLPVDHERALRRGRDQASDHDLTTSIPDRTISRIGSAGLRAGRRRLCSS